MYHIECLITPIHLSYLPNSSQLKTTLFVKASPICLFFVCFLFVFCSEEEVNNLMDDFLEKNKSKDLSRWVKRLCGENVKNTFRSINNKTK